MKRAINITKWLLSAVLLCSLWMGCANHDSMLGVYTFKQSNLADTLILVGHGAYIHHSVLNGESHYSGGKWYFIDGQVELNDWDNADGLLDNTVFSKDSTNVSLPVNWNGKKIYLNQRKEAYFLKSSDSYVVQ